MKPQRVAILFDSHTPYLAFRVNALQKELVEKGWDKQVEIHVILIGADEKSYQWNQESLREQYHTHLHVLSPTFHGLGLQSFLHPTLPGILWRLLRLYYRLRPMVTLVGGYDRPESIFCRILSYPILGKVGVMHDSRFNDAESFSKNIWLEFAKSLVIARYSFFMVPGRECADYTRFLGGRNKPVYQGAWNVVDNEGIAAAAADPASDEEIYSRFHLPAGSPFFLLPARFVQKKNIPFTIRAYAEYCRMTDQPHVLVLCGQGPLGDEIRALIHSLSLGDRVKLCDWLPYHLMPRACRLSAAVLLPSLYDQWGMTVNESLSAGTPVLVSNRCGAHELVQNHQNGYTFAPDDSAHLTTLLSQLHADPELLARLRSNARASMATFSIKTYVAQHIRLLQDYDVIPDSKTDATATTQQEENQPA